MDARPIVVIAVGLIARSASALPIIAMDQVPVEVSALRISDASWDLGEDWGYSDSHVWMNEEWLGNYGSYVELEQSIELDDGRGGTQITLHKSVLNTTNFFWTDYHIDLLPNPGNSGIFNVQAQPSAQFGNVTVVDNGDGTWSIWWDNFNENGSGVGIGGTGMFDMSFDIGSDMSFRLIQRPTPEPSTLALLILGSFGLFGRRGRQVPE